MTEDLSRGDPFAHYFELHVTVRPDLERLAATLAPLGFRPAFDNGGADLALTGGNELSPGGPRGTPFGVELSLEEVDQGGWRVGVWVREKFDEFSIGERPSEEAYLKAAGSVRTLLERFLTAQ